MFSKSQGQKYEDKNVLKIMRTKCPQIYEDENIKILRTKCPQNEDKISLIYENNNVLKIMRTKCHQVPRTGMFSNYKNNNVLKL
ncbi:unnamed protein product [Rhizophagus irregularis]|nr:unnamed protein product [Rhizophagus irregularis]